MTTRREFLRSLPLLATAGFSSCRKRRPLPETGPGGEGSTAEVYRALNGRPAQNMEKIVSMMGGSASLFDIEDVVILKPNLQWHNQGAPNIAAMDRLVGLIMEREGGFRGEVVLAENTHRGSKPWERTGWAVPFERNSDLEGIANYGDLARSLKERYAGRFSVCHLVDVASGGRRVFGPQDGPGYVFCDGTGGVPRLAVDNGLDGETRREAVLSYPVLRTDRGTIIDYRWGVWEGGAYTGRPVKFVNCAALNHHSAYCGMTSAVKNYLGVCDLSGGSDPAAKGPIPGSRNFHAFAFDGNRKGPRPGMLGKAVGAFLKMVRKPFLNITTAEVCGLASRLEPPVAWTKAILASADPVALDVHAAKHVLFANSRISVHDPEDPDSPTSQYLRSCSAEGEFCFDESKILVHSFDFSSRTAAEDRELGIEAETEWGGNIKALLKFAAFRVL